MVPSTHYAQNAKWPRAGVTLIGQLWPSHRAVTRRGESSRGLHEFANLAVPRASLVTSGLAQCLGTSPKISGYQGNEGAPSGKRFDEQNSGQAGYPQGTFAVQRPSPRRLPGTNPYAIMLIKILEFIGSHLDARQGGRLLAEMA